MHFGTYELSLLKTDPRRIMLLGDGVVADIAECFGYPTDGKIDADYFSGLIKAIAPHKELRDNIAFLKGRAGDTRLSSWLKRSGVLNQISGSFADPALTQLPEHIGAAVFTGGTANWLLRRLDIALRLDPENVGEVIVAAGNRPMQDREHQLVANLSRKLCRQPFEYEFVRRLITPQLRAAGFTVRCLPLNVSSGDVIYKRVVEGYPSLMNTTVLSISNAPHTIQAAGQLRAVAHTINPTFDVKETQLYMLSDQGVDTEGAPTYQNPQTALGQILRNALFLAKNCPPVNN